jgi:hypothetical protein
MTEQHPITPPPELVEQWCSETEYATPGRVALHTISEQRLFQLLTRSAQWGYEQVNEAELQQARDEELEACCDWMSECTVGCPNELRAARRPPASLKKQALRAAHIEVDPQGKNGSLIIRALEDSND